MDTASKAIGVKNMNQPSFAKTLQAGSAMVLPSFSAFCSYPSLYLRMPISLAKVVGVADGDTISVMREDRAARGRLAGNDCPEKGQAFGTRTKRFTSDLAFGKKVKVRVRTYDRYGCIVGDVILPDGTNSNQEFVMPG